MKLCKDCIYFRPIYLLCERPEQLEEPDLVTGKTHYNINHYAESQRKYWSNAAVTCGTEGKYWKPTLKYRIIKLFKKNEDSITK